MFQSVLQKMPGRSGGIASETPSNHPGSALPSMSGWNQKPPRASRQAQESDPRRAASELPQRPHAGDSSLITTMAARLRVLENSQREMRNALASKEREVLTLRRENQTLHEALDADGGESVRSG